MRTAIVLAAVWLTLCPVAASGQGCMVFSDDFDSYVCGVQSFGSWVVDVIYVGDYVGVACDIFQSEPNSMYFYNLTSGPSSAYAAFPDVSGGLLEVEFFMHAPNAYDFGQVSLSLEAGAEGPCAGLGSGLGFYRSYGNETIGFGPDDVIMQTTPLSQHTFRIVANLDAETFSVFIDGVLQVIDRDLFCSHVDGLTVRAVEGEGWVDDICVTVPASPATPASWGCIKSLFRP